MILNDNLLKNLKALSCNVGCNVSYVQGGGGNTSVKTDGGLMAIKASGYLLKDMTEEDGFALVDYLKINDFIKILNDLISEDEYNKTIKAQIKDIKGCPMLRPSIETGFNSLLNKYVAHTHSIYANILTCSKEGEGLSRKLFPNSIWVEYHNPGKDLTLAMRDAIQNPGNKEIVFLKNHGFVVSADTFEKTLKLHEDINERIIKYFDLKKKFVVDDNIQVDIKYLNNNVIFPDQIVYSVDETLRKTRAGIETLCAYKYIIETIVSLGLNLSLISKENVSYLQNMESEKYRKRLAK